MPSQALLSLGGAHWVDNLARHALSRPDRVAIRFEGRSITWSELEDRVARLAGALAQRGVGRGDRVAVLMLNRPEFVETVLAANRIGAIAVPVNFRLVAAEISYVLGDSGAKVVVTDAALAPVAAASVAGGCRGVGAGGGAGASVRACRRGRGCRRGPGCGCRRVRGVGRADWRISARGGQGSANR